MSHNFLGAFISSRLCCVTQHYEKICGTKCMMMDVAYYVEIFTEIWWTHQIPTNGSGFIVKEVHTSRTGYFPYTVDFSSSGEKAITSPRHQLPLLDRTHDRSYTLSRYAVNPSKYIVGCIISFQLEYALEFGRSLSEQNTAT